MLATSLPLVDSWHRRFGTAPVNARVVLKTAIEQDLELLEALRVIDDDFLLAPLPRALNRWLLRHENAPFFDSAERPYRFVKDPSGWSLRPARALVPEAAA